MKNYIDICPCSLGRGRIVVYLDTADHLGIVPLNRHRVRLKYCADRYSKNDCYRMIILKVLKKDMDRFRAAMEDLANNMLICGYTDYETRGAEMIADMEKRFRQAMEESGKDRLRLGRIPRAKPAG